MNWLMTTCCGNAKIIYHYGPSWTVTLFSLSLTHTRAHMRVQAHTQKKTVHTWLNLCDKEGSSVHIATQRMIRQERF